MVNTEQMNRMAGAMNRLAVHEAEQKAQVADDTEAIRQLLLAEAKRNEQRDIDESRRYKAMMIVTCLTLLCAVLGIVLAALAFALPYYNGTEASAAPTPLPQAQGQ